YQPRSIAMAYATAQPGQTRVGFLGTGVMGQAMAGHLFKAGYGLSVFTRTKSKAQPLLEAGATWCVTPRDAAERSDIVCSIVGYPKDVREVYLGSNGLVAAARPGMIFVDMTTSEPSLAIEIAAAAKAKGAAALDAPVSGGD